MSPVFHRCAEATEGAISTSIEIVLGQVGRLTHYADGQPRTFQISYCPFCGERMPNIVSPSEGAVKFADDDSAMQWAEYLAAYQDPIKGTVGSGSTPSVIANANLEPPPYAVDQHMGRLLLFLPNTLTPELRGRFSDVVKMSKGPGGEIKLAGELPVAPAFSDTVIIV
jgi:hypothetical protein